MCVLRSAPRVHVFSLSGAAVTQLFFSPFGVQ
jgi:hypothetical protein